jgi:hypothetical protein
MGRAVSLSATLCGTARADGSLQSALCESVCVFVCPGALTDAAAAKAQTGPSMGTVAQKRARARKHTDAHPRARAHEHTHPHARAHAHTHPPTRARACADAMRVRAQRCAVSLTFLDGPTGLQAKSGSHWNAGNRYLPVPSSTLQCRAGTGARPRVLFQSATICVGHAYAPA